MTGRLPQNHKKKKKNYKLAVGEDSKYSEAVQCDEGV